jgi:hypothetical protein
MLMLDSGPVLLSLRLKEDDQSGADKARSLFDHLKAKEVVYDLFFHSFDGLEIEHEFLENVRRVYCGNAEITHALRGIKKPISSVWCPSLLDDTHGLRTTKLNLFSFGMAHKIQVKHYRHLSEILQRYGDDHTLWLSTAFHEKADFGDFDSISSQLKDIFRDRVQFLGFLSDDGVNYFLQKTQLFVAFFEKGVRANNTSLLGAMKRGCAVLSNCDEHSPDWLKHGENILDIYRTKPEELADHNLKRINSRAKRDVMKYASWEALVEILQNPEAMQSQETAEAGFDIKPVAERKRSTTAPMLEELSYDEKGAN